MALHVCESERQIRSVDNKIITEVLCYVSVESQCRACCLATPLTDKYGGLIHRPKGRILDDIKTNGKSFFLFRTSSLRSFFSF